MSQKKAAMPDEIFHYLDGAENSRSAYEDYVKQLIKTRIEKQDSIRKVQLNFESLKTTNLDLKDKVIKLENEAKEMESDVLNFLQSNKDLSGRVSELENKLKNFRSSQNRNLEEFEDELANLAKFFLEASKNFYDDQKVQENLSNVTIQEENSANKMIAAEADIRNAEKELERISGPVFLADGWERELPLEQRGVVLQLLEEGNERVCKILEETKKHKELLQDEIQHLQKA